MRKVFENVKNRATSAAESWASWSAQTSLVSRFAKASIVAFVAMFTLATPAYASAGAQFISDAIDQLGIVIIAIGGGLGIWGIVNLLEGYGNDNPGAKSQG